METRFSCWVLLVEVANAVKRFLSQIILLLIIISITHFLSFPFISFFFFFYLLSHFWPNFPCFKIVLYCSYFPLVNSIVKIAPFFPIYIVFSFSTSGSEKSKRGFFFFFLIFFFTIWALKILIFQAVFANGYWSFLLLGENFEVGRF